MVVHCPDVYVMTTFKIGEGEHAAAWSGIVIRQEHVIDCPGLIIRCSNEANIAFIEFNPGRFTSKLRRLATQ